MASLFLSFNCLTIKANNVLLADRNACCCLYVNIQDVFIKTSQFFTTLTFTKLNLLLKLNLFLYFWELTLTSNILATLAALCPSGSSLSHHLYPQFRQLLYPLFEHLITPLAKLCHSKNTLVYRYFFLWLSYNPWWNCFWVWIFYE